jgi:hypothetical protein
VEWKEAVSADYMLGDITDDWVHMMNRFDYNSIFANDAAPYGWNDPDMLEVCGDARVCGVTLCAHVRVYARTLLLIRGVRLV